MHRWFSSHSIRKKFLILNLTLGCLLVGIVGFAFVRLQRVASINRAMIESTEAINALSDLRYELATLRGRHISVLMDPGNADWVSGRMDMAKANDAAITGLVKTLDGARWSPSETELWTSSREGLKAYLGGFSGFLERARTEVVGQKARLDLGRKELDAARKGFDELLNRRAAEDEATLGAAQRLLSTTLVGLACLGGLGILVGGLIGWGVSRQVTQDTGCLLDRMRALAAGDLSARSPLGSRDEIGHMGSAFNAVADSLSRILDEIGHVSERTASGSTQLASTLAAMVGVTRAITQDAEQQRDSVIQSRRVLDEMKGAVAEVETASERAVQEATASQEAGEGGIASVRESSHAMEAILESSYQVAFY